MSRRRDILVGAVSYHPRVVTVWERFRDYFPDRGLHVDYVLYSNYERLVEDLLSARVDIAWCTNTAYVMAEHRVDGETRLLGMRDVDVAFRSVLVQRSDTAVGSDLELKQRRLALGSRDCGHATILPIHYLSQQGFDLGHVEVVRFEEHLGKHGDTGHAEASIAEAVSNGTVDVGAMADVTWAMLRTEGVAAAADLSVVWRSPAYCHCTFVALPDLDDGLSRAWLEALLSMDYGDSELRPAMDLEGVKRWLLSDRSGYEELAVAMAAQGYLGS